MSFWVPPRRPSAELLDGDPSAAEAEASLGDIEWVHRRLGGRRLVRRRLLPFLESLDPGARRELSLLDLGCGSGHVGRDLTAHFLKKGRTIAVHGLDRQLVNARLAPRGRTLLGDALRLPLPDGSVDVVLSTLFFHHLTPDELATLLGEAARVARRGVVAFDLARHRASLAFASLFGPILFRSPLSRHDGPASVRQAYTPHEMAAIAAPFLPGVSLRPAGAFVWELTWRRS